MWSVVLISYPQMPLRLQTDFPLCVFAPLLQDGRTLRGAEGGDVDLPVPRKSSSSRSSRKSFRLDYRLEVKPQNLFSSKTFCFTWNTHSHTCSFSVTSTHLKPPNFHKLPLTTWHLSGSVSIFFCVWCFSHQTLILLFELLSCNKHSTLALKYRFTFDCRKKWQSPVETNMAAGPTPGPHGGFLPTQCCSGSCCWIKITAMYHLIKRWVTVRPKFYSLLLTTLLALYAMSQMVQVQLCTKIVQAVSDFTCTIAVLISIRSSFFFPSVCRNIAFCRLSQPTQYL